MNGREREECLRSGRVPWDYPNPVAADWPDLLTIVEHRVKPERIVKNAKNTREWCTNGGSIGMLGRSLKRLFLN